MSVYLAVANGLRIIRAFIYEPLCDKFVADWNADPENENDQCHKEDYAVDQNGDHPYIRR